MIGYTYIKTNGRDIGSKPLRWAQASFIKTGSASKKLIGRVHREAKRSFQNMDSKPKTGNVDSTHIKALYLGTCIRL
jgi:hypothetical protein